MKNRYTRTWFELFLPPETGAKHEVNYLQKYLPPERVRTILDVGCGWGRHARPLANRGYGVVGIERDPAIVEEARRDSPAGFECLQMDMRNLREVPGRFDAVICMWATFGCFDSAENRRVLWAMDEKLNPEGRVILDIDHRMFFERHQGVREFERGGYHIRETKTVRGERLSVYLDYGRERDPDVFDWELFTPTELSRAAMDIRWDCLSRNSGFDSSLPPTPEQPRMQFVFEKGSKGA